MQTKGKRLLLIGGSLFLSLGAITVTTISANSAFSYGLDAAGEKFEVLFNGTNGNATVETKKTTIAAGAKTSHNNDVSVEYKNMSPVGGKIGKLNAPMNGFKAYYGNATPINGISSITVSSNAQAGDAFLVYGKTSVCLDGQVDLATGVATDIYAHYFKIVANSEVTINQVGIELACENDDNGLDTKYNSTSYNYQFQYVDYSTANKTYTLKRNTDGVLSSAIIPDFYDGEDGFGYITYLAGKTTSYGMFEGAHNTLERVVMPETITGFGNYFFTGSSYDKLEELTIPRELTTINGTSCNTIPRSASLKTVHYHAKSLSYTNSSGRFDKDKQTALETVTVSADVVSLPNNLVNSFRDGVTIYYEGTEAEWASLVADAPNWNTATNIICSDTTLATITFSFANATLGDNEDSMSMDIIVGREVANPGTPVSKDGTKIFDGWYTEPAGAGSKVTFPFVASVDSVFYANFVDIPAGYSIDSPIDAVLGNVYSFSTDAVNSFGYVRYTATAPIVVIAYATNWVSSGTCNFSVYDAEDTSSTVYITTGNGADTDIKDGPTAPTSSGANVPVKIRMGAGDSFIYKFGSAGNAATFDVIVREVTSGEDYTTAIALNVMDTYTVIPVVQYGVKWLTFNIPVEGDYCFAGKTSTSTWAGMSIGTISGTTYTSKTGSTFNNPGTDGIESVVHLEAGTYYAPITSNGAQSVSVKMYSVIPTGYAKSTATTIAVGGEAVTVTGVKQVAPMWYKFTVASAGRYIITSNNNMSKATGSNSWWTSTHYVGVYAEDDTMQTLTNVKSGDNKRFYADLEAGVYYIKAAAYAYGSSDYSYTLAVSMASPVTLTFNTAGGSSIAPADGYAGFSFSKPADPTKSGFRFDGWYTEAGGAGEAVSFPYAIDADTEIFAKWVKQVTVTLHANNEEAATTEDVDIGTEYTPADPTYPLHQFLGWYTDELLSTPYVNGTALTADIDLYAKWESANYDGSGANYIDKEVTGAASFLLDAPAGITKPNASDYDFVVYRNHADYGTGIKSSNAGINSSASRIQLNFKVATLFSFSYAVQSEGAYSIVDKFNVYNDGVKLFTKGGATLDEGSVEPIRVEAGKSLLIEYTKDYSGNSGLDAVYIYNMVFAAAPVILDHITLDTTGAVTAFENGATFSSEGLVVTAHYSDGSSSVVTTGITVVEPAMTDDTKQTVTVKYTEDDIEKSATYQIVVGNPPHYTNSAANYIEGLAGASTYLDDFDEDNPPIYFGSKDFIRSTGTYDGIKSNIYHQSSSTATIYIRFKAACTFSFTYKISSESGWDKAYIRINGSTHTGPIDGSSTKEVSLTIAAGDVVSFSYEKDGSGDTGDDTFYVYGFSFAAIA